MESRPTARAHFHSEAHPESPLRCLGTWSRADEFFRLLPRVSIDAEAGEIHFLCGGCRTVRPKLTGSRGRSAKLEGAVHARPSAIWHLVATRNPRTCARGP